MRLQDLKKGDIIRHPNNYIHKLILDVSKTGLPIDHYRVKTFQLRSMFTEEYVFSVSDWNMIYKSWHHISI